MNIKRALKEKNKLVAKIAEEKMKVQIFNSVEVGAERPYDPRIALEEWISNIDKLVELKAKIHKANSKVYDKIFTLGVYVKDKLMGVGSGPSKQVAQQEAAQAALEKYSKLKTD